MIGVGVGVGINAGGGAGGTTLGPELIVDPGFDNPAAWSSNGPTVSGSALHWASSTTGKSASPTPAITAQIGSTYRVLFTITAISSGTISASMGGASTTGQITPGTYTQNVVATTTGGPALRNSGTTTADVDNFSVKLLS